MKSSDSRRNWTGGKQFEYYFELNREEQRRKEIKVVGKNIIFETFTKFRFLLVAIKTQVSNWRVRIWNWTGKQFEYYFELNTEEQRRKETKVVRKNIIFEMFTKFRFLLVAIKTQVSNWRVRDEIGERKLDICDVRSRGNPWWHIGGKQFEHYLESNKEEQRKETRGEEYNIRDIRSGSLEFIRVYEISFCLFSH